MRLWRRAMAWRAAITRVANKYQQVHGRAPRIFRPRRFSEKMQWRKLFDNNPLFPVFCDKLAVRAYITERAGAEYLAPLLWSGRAMDIPFDRIDPPYVLKTSHASSQVLMVARDTALDREAIRKLAEDWLAAPFGAMSDEPGYVDVPPRLMIERTLLDEAGMAPLERRLFVFGGKVAVINTVFTEAGRLRNGAFHLPDWTRLDWHFSRWIAEDFPAPAGLRRMIKAAELLGAGIDHIRVDFYDCGETIIISEITVYSWSGLSVFTPDEADFALGAYWRLRAPWARALFACGAATNKIQAILDTEGGDR